MKVFKAPDYFKSLITLFSSSSKLNAYADSIGGDSRTSPFAYTCVIEKS